MNDSLKFGQSRKASPILGGDEQVVLSEGKDNWSRRRFLRTGLGAAAGVAALPALSTRAKADGASFDFTFYHLGDTHYMGFDTSLHEAALVNPLNRANLQRMTAMTPATSMPVAGTVGTPVGVIHVGDLINSEGDTDPGTGLAVPKAQLLEMQWTNYINDFGLLGTEVNTLVKLPVYEGYGNHDQDGFLQQVSDRIALRSAQLPGITARSGTFSYVNAFGNITVSAVHYAWKWGPVHFVQANIRSGDGMDRMPSSGSYTFLRHYLENVIGANGDPVMVIVHYPPDVGTETGPAGSVEWPVADKQAFYDLLIRFNVIGILCGHTHSFGSYTWSGPGGNGPVAVPVYRSERLWRATGGFMNVFRITNDPLDPTKGRLVMAQRTVENSWSATVTTRSFSLSTVPALLVNRWQSVNLHNGTAYGLTIADNTFVEPRQGGLRQIEIRFAEAIVVPNLAAAVSITGITSAGSISSLASLGITPHVALAASGDTLVVTFSNNSGAAALPDAAKWRLTLNPSAITGSSGAALAATSRVLTGLVGDFDGNGRVSGIDLNAVADIAAFDPALAACLRADINGDSQIGPADVAAAWANRHQRTDTLGTPL